MLEIIFIIVLWNQMGQMMRKRGFEKPFWFQLLVPFCWFGGEFLVGFIYGLIRVLQGKEVDGFDFTLYLFALAGAAFVTGTWFLIAGLFSRRPEAPPPFSN